MQELTADLAASIGRIERCIAWTLRKALAPLGSAPLVLLAAGVLPTATRKVQVTAFHVLLATLAEAHVGQPFCSILSAAAAWDLMDGHHWLLRASVCYYIAVVSPAFPLDGGTPHRSERVADLAPTDAGMPDVNGVARDLLAELTEVPEMLAD